MDCGVEFETCKCRIEISILEILCAPISRQNGEISSF